jgi:hypothetical protein
MFYVIEKQDAEWVVLAHGVAIMRCADPDMALEIVQIAQQQLCRLEYRDDLEAAGGAEVPSVQAPSVAPQQAAVAPAAADLQVMTQHRVTGRQNKPVKLP